VKRLGELTADMETGEGHLEISPFLAQQSAPFRADVLQDWLGALTEAYNQAVNDMSPHRQGFQDYDA